MKRELIPEVRKTYQISFRFACRALTISRSVAYYKPLAGEDFAVIQAMQAAREEEPTAGYQLITRMLRKQGYPWNRKRIYRVYCQLGWNKRRKRKQRLPARDPQPLHEPEMLNESWSMDFMSDSLWSGRTFRTFNVIDDCNREVLGIDVDLNLPAERVIRKLDQIAEFRGYPKQIRCDNGPELISHAMREWAKNHNVHLEYIKPGKPTQNSYIERLNKTYRDAVLDLFVFETLHQVRQKTAEWMDRYNERRPHLSLGDLTPVEKREQLLVEFST
jgi:putative transposase